MKKKQSIKQCVLDIIFLLFAYLLGIIVGMAIK